MEPAPIEHHAWQSPNTGIRMPLVRHGIRGPVLIYVPSSGGDEQEFERYRMLETCGEWIEAGRVQIVSIDGLARNNLWNTEIPPRERIRAYARFERYAVEELLPWVSSTAGDDRPGVVGASYGAFLAANLLLKHPRRVSLACGLGGVYGLWHRLDGYHDDDVYYHTPLEYLPRLEDQEILGEIRRTRGLVMYGGERDEWLPSTRRLAEILGRKRIPHEVEIWPAPADHHERWWRRQLARFLERHY